MDDDDLQNKKIRDYLEAFVFEAAASCSSKHQQDITPFIHFRVSLEFEILGFIHNAAAPASAGSEKKEAGLAAGRCPLRLLPSFFSPHCLRLLRVIGPRPQNSLAPRAAPPPRSALPPHRRRAC